MGEGAAEEIVAEVSAPREKRASLMEFEKTNSPIKTDMRKAGVAMGNGCVISFHEAHGSVGLGDQVPRA